jgi:hypothetical protein
MLLDNATKPEVDLSPHPASINAPTASPGRNFSNNDLPPTPRNGLVFEDQLLRLIDLIPENGTDAVPEDPSARGAQH